MTRIDDTFARLKADGKKAFVAYVMAGDPDYETSRQIVLGLPDAGVDIIELGLPFTDPMADGPTIQLAGQRALDGGMTLEKTLALQPMEPSAVKTLSKIYMRTGEEARAEALLASYLQENPQDLEAIGVQSELIVTTRDFQEGEKQLTQLLSQHPDNLEVQARLAKWYFDHGRYEQVSVQTENLSERAIREQPSLMELRGKSLANLGNAEGSLPTRVKDRSS